MSMLRVKLVKSPIGQNQNVRRTMEALGLRKMNYVKEFNDNPQINGMLFKVKHLVKIEKI